MTSVPPVPLYDNKQQVSSLRGTQLSQLKEVVMKDPDLEDGMPDFDPSLSLVKCQVCGAETPQTTITTASDKHPNQVYRCPITICRSCAEAGWSVNYTGTWRLTCANRKTHALVSSPPASSADLPLFQEPSAKRAEPTTEQASPMPLGATASKRKNPSPKKTA